MKQTTTTEQTLTLIKLGFDKPKHFIEGPTFLDSGFAHTIGELIDMLPKAMDCEIGDMGLNIENNIYETPNEWMVSYDSRHITNSIELVDALFDMIVMLKKEGVI